MLLHDMPKYLRSNSSVRLFIDVASRADASIVRHPPLSHLQLLVQFRALMPRDAGAKALEHAHGRGHLQLLRAQLRPHAVGQVMVPRHALQRML